MNRCDAVVLEEEEEEEGDAGNGSIGAVINSPLAGRSWDDGAREKKMQRSARQLEMWCGPVQVASWCLESSN